MILKCKNCKIPALAAVAADVCEFGLAVNSFAASLMRVHVVVVVVVCMGAKFLTTVKTKKKVRIFSQEF